MSRQSHIFVIVTTLLILTFCMQILAAEEPKPVRIGVYVRSGFEECLDRWSPTADYLTRTIPDHHFTIVPLASREDIFNSLESGQIDFLATNSAIYVCTEERFGTSAICGMTNKVDPSGHDCTGCLIRKADRDDLAKVEDLRGARLSAVKPWSFSGWIMQWQSLNKHHIDPLRNMAPVLYEGTHQEVIQSVLDGTADVGAVGTDILKQQIKSGKIDPKSLFVFNRKGEAVEIKEGVIASTDAYPDWVFAKTAKVPDPLAEKVLKSLMAFDRDSQANTEAYQVAWTIPQNYQSVRDTLHELLGRDYAYTDKISPKPNTMLLALAKTIAIGAIAVLAVILFIAWRRARGRENNTHEELRSIHSELNEVRASKHLIETILTQVKCGMDIVNEDNEIVYVTPGLEHHYGPWRGKRCYEYYWGSSKPCEHCTKRAASEHRNETDPYAGSCHVTLQDDYHPIGDPSRKGKQGKLLQVPFYDENGRWLYARVHLPPEEALIKLEAESMVANQH